MFDWRFWLGLGLTLPQALYVRSTALRLGPAAGPRQGLLQGPGPELKLLLVGDSIIAGVGVDELHNALPGQLAKTLSERTGRSVGWHAVGEGGLDAGEVHDQLLPGLTPAAADLIVVSIGVNDVTGLRTSRQWRERLSRLLDRLAAEHASGPTTPIVHLGIPPLGHFPALRQPLRALFGHRAARLDAIAKTVIAERPWGIHIASEFVPDANQFAEDGYHPNADACNQWAEGIVDRLPKGALQPRLVDS